VKRLELLIAYSIACASATLASLYGFMSASGYYGLAKGLGLCCVAFVGCHGPAWIGKVKRELGWPAALFGCLATAACLGVTLYGGLGTIASGGADLRAENAKVSGDSARNLTTLKRLSAEREAMRFTATDTEAVRAAQAAANAAERIRALECEKRGPSCRTRESEEQAKLEALTLARTNKSLTDQAAKLDGQIAALSAKLDNAPPVKAADPQASTFSQLTGFSVDTSAALYAFLFSIALETAAMFAMMVAYSTPKPAMAAVVAVQPKPAAVVEEKPSNVVALVSSNPPAVSLIEFAAGALTREAGANIEFDDFYLAYWQHCKAIDGRAVAPSEAVEQTNQLCAECGIGIQRRGKKRFLVGVRLKSASNSKRLGPMAQQGKAS
jgi:hypothetical protein